MAAARQEGWSRWTLRVGTQLLKSAIISATAATVAETVYIRLVPEATPETAKQFATMVGSMVMVMQNAVPHIEERYGLAKLMKEHTAPLKIVAIRAFNALGFALAGLAIAEIAREAAPPHETIEDLEANAKAFPLALATIEIVKDLVRLGTSYVTSNKQAEFWAAVVAELGLIVGVVPYILSGMTGAGTDTSDTRYVADSFFSAIATVVTMNKGAEFIGACTRRLMGRDRDAALHPVSPTGLMPGTAGTLDTRLLQPQPVEPGAPAV